MMNSDKERELLRLLLKQTPLVLAILFLMSCGGESREEASSVSPISVEVYEVMEEAFSVTIRSTGELLPMEETEIRSAVSGHVMQVHFEEGGLVRKGDLLVTLDSRRWQAQRQGLQARLEAALAELERRVSMRKVDGVSEAEVEQTRAEVATLQSQLEELDVLIDLSQIRAPFAGTLGMRDFSVGAYMREGDLITRIVQTDFLRIDFSIPARYRSLMDNGATVSVVSASSGEETSATIYAVDPLVSRDSRSMQARARIDNRGAQFSAGDFVRVGLAVEQSDDALLIPAEAIIPELNRQVVYVAKNGQAERREVTTGARTRDRIQITEGVQPGDLVIVTGLMVMRDGADIQTSRMDREATP